MRLDTLCCSASCSNFYSKLVHSSYISPQTWIKGTDVQSFTIIHKQCFPSIICN